MAITFPSGLNIYVQCSITKYLWCSISTVLFCYVTVVADVVAARCGSSIRLNHMWLTELTLLRLPGETDIINIINCSAHLEGSFYIGFVIHGNTSYRSSSSVSDSLGLDIDSVRSVTNIFKCSNIIIRTFFCINFFIKIDFGICPCQICLY